MNKVAFYTGLSVFIVGLILWIVRPRGRGGRNAIKFAGMEFSLGTPDFVVMVLGVVLMVLSPAFPDYFGSPPVNPVMVCTGEFEDQCPGAHDAYYYCGYFGSDDDIAKGICKSAPVAHARRLKTVSGNKCGYSLIQVTCG
jgi:hypothetical protein